jgi:glycosyltransferase involved in cell wall biosynthesis
MSLKSQRIAVITPVFNDGACLAPFLADLASASGLPAETTVLVIDDGSTDLITIDPASVPPELGSVEILHLGCNLGHQRAIATGLVEAVHRGMYDAIIVIDADGEDRPQDVSALLAAHRESPDAIIVAKRRSRQEALQFRVFYGIYKALFHLLTGRKLDFGNFSLVPADAAQRMVLMGELWNHYPATVMRSRIPIVRVALDRQSRYAGRSRMNFTSLVNHGLAGIAAFVDTAFARLLVFAVALTGVFGLLAVAGIVLRLVSSVPIPGWAALGASVAMIGFIQIIAALVVLSFLTLSARSVASPPPAKFAEDYVARIEKVR